MNHKFIYLLLCELVSSNPVIQNRYNIKPDEFMRLNRKIEHNVKKNESFLNKTIKSNSKQQQKK